MDRIAALLQFARENSVPYHNSCPDRYFFGNSIVGASGYPSGEWDFEIGPDYTSPQFIASERLSLWIDGTKIPLDFQMKRLRGTGVFFGEAQAEGVRLSLFDFAPPECQWLLRLFFCEGVAPDSTARLCADIIPWEGEGRAEASGVTIEKDTESFCFGNRETKNWATRRCTIRFSGENAICPFPVEETVGFTLQTPLREICTLLHENTYEGESLPQMVDAVDLLEKTLAAWKAWSSVSTLPSIQEQRDADAVESLLFSVKMQQNRDGGAIAGIRKYANSYIRDTHGCARMLRASGHLTEVKKIILNIHSRYEKAGFIPNWWSMGSDTFIGHSFQNDISEITAYYLFMVRDYLEKTGDTQLLQTVHSSVEYAAMSQLDWLRNHDYTMDFNGDETEQYCCNEDHTEYGGFQPAEYAWNRKALSFPSMAAAVASLEWYSRVTGISLEEDLAKLRKKIDAVFLDAERGIHVWAAEKTAEGYRHHAAQVTDFLLLPMWIGAKLLHGREKTDAALVRSFVREDGFLPNSPEAMAGFCGHTMGMYLDVMLKLGEWEEAEKAARQILDSPLLSMYGTVAEFYGPSCTPNGHMCRGFEGGILGQALIDYFSSGKL